MDLSDLLKGDINDQLVGGVAQQLGIGNEQAKTAVSAAIPVILSGLQKNANQGGAEGIINALSKGHDGSILDNISGFLNGGNFSDGNSILGHVFGNQQSDVAKALGKSSGINASQMASIMAILAPIVMGYLGKQNSQNTMNAGGLTSVLGSLLGGNNQGGNILGSLLGGGQSNSGGLGGAAMDILGNLLGGKK